MAEQMVLGGTEVSRAERVRRDLIALKLSVTVNFFEIGDLLLEAKENGYHMDWGYQNFGEWVEQNMDMSERQGYYLMKIVEGHKKLGINRHSLVNINISKLKSIFSLDADKYGDEIQKLLAAAPSNSPDEISAMTQKVRDGVDAKPLLYLTIKVSPEVKKMVKDAFELVKATLGRNASDSECLELIVADYTAGISIANQSQEESGSLS